MVACVSPRHPSSLLSIESSFPRTSAHSEHSFALPKPEADSHWRHYELTLPSQLFHFNRFARGVSDSLSCYHELAGKTFA